MSKSRISLTPPKNSMHGGQYKTANVCDATRGRVVIDPKRSISEMSRPKGRTAYLSGTKNASTNAK